MYSQVGVGLVTIVEVQRDFPEVVVDVEDGVGVLEVEVVVEETTGGVYPQGWMDSKSLAPYKFNAPGPPQVSVLSPEQGMLQLLLSIGTLPLPITTPQKH